MSALKKSFLAIIFSMTIAAPAVSMAAAQPVVDVDSLNELKQIRAVLEQNNVKTYTCMDGDKQYTAGLFATINGADYRCTVKGDHAEWDMIPRTFK